MLMNRPPLRLVSLAPGTDRAPIMGAILLGIITFIYGAILGFIVGKVFF
jgi:hypothetical protein